MALRRKLNIQALAAASVFVVAAMPMRAEQGISGVTAVYARASKDYVRSRLPDGSFQPETFAFGEGGNWGGELKDQTIDKLHFIDVAHVIAEPLAVQKYIPTKDPNKTKILIMVYWGTTTVPMPYDEDPMYENFQSDIREYRTLLSEGAADEAEAVYNSGLIQLNMANQIRDRMDYKNAAMLGYNSDSSALIATDYGVHIGQTALGIEQRDEVAEIEENRYFVVLMAYDFQLLWKQKKHKLLWETRLSISERRNAFDKALPFMAQDASKYFGQATKGIVRTRVLDGHVEIGELKSLGEADGSKK
jgi:hypothetical protein